MKMMRHAVLETAAIILALTAIITSAKADSYPSLVGSGRIELAMARLDARSATTKMLASTGVREVQGVLTSSDEWKDTASLDLSILRRDTENDPLASYRCGKPEPLTTLQDLSHAPPASRMMSKREFIGFALTHAGAILPPFRVAAKLYRDYYSLMHGQSFKVDISVNPLRDRYRMGVTIVLP